MTKKIIRKFLQIVLAMVCIFTGLGIRPMLEAHMEELREYNLKNWMGYFDDGISLSQLNMPGTHDTGTLYIDPIAQDGGRTQDYNPYEQLCHGVRVLDVRAGAALIRIGDYTWKDMGIYHGIFTCRDYRGCEGGMLTVATVVDDCLKFVHENRTESVVMYLTDEFNEDKTRELIGKMYERCRADRPDNPSDYYNDVRFYKFGDVVPTLGEARGKVIVISDYDKLPDSPHRARMYTKFEDHASVWDNVKMDWLREVVAEGHIGEQDYTIRNRFVEDPDDGACKNSGIWEEPNIKMVFTSCNTVPSPGGGPRTLADKINPKLPDLFCEKGKRYGWVMMDFIDDDLCTMIIETNKTVHDFTWESTLDFTWQKSPEHEFNLWQEWNEGHFRVMEGETDLLTALGGSFKDHYTIELNETYDTITLTGRLQQWLPQVDGTETGHLHRPILVYTPVDPMYNMTLKGEEDWREGYGQYNRRHYHLSFKTEPMPITIRFEDHNNEDGQRPKNTDELVKLVGIQGNLYTGSQEDTPYHFTVEHTQEEAMKETAATDVNVPYIVNTEFTDTTNIYHCTIQNLPALNDNGEAFRLRRLVSAGPVTRIPYTARLELGSDGNTILVLEKQKAVNVEAVLTWKDGVIEHTDPVQDQLHIKLEKQVQRGYEDVTEEYMDHFYFEPTGEYNQYRIGFSNLPPASNDNYLLSLGCGLEGIHVTRTKYDVEEKKTTVTHTYEFQLKHDYQDTAKEFTLRWKDADYFEETSGYYDRPETTRALTQEMHLQVLRTDYDGSNPRVITIVEGDGRNYSPNVNDHPLRRDDGETTLSIWNLLTEDKDSYLYHYELLGFEQDSEHYTWELKQDENEKIIVLTHKPQIIDFEANVTFLDGDDAFGKRSDALQALNNRSVAITGTYSTGERAGSIFAQFNAEGTYHQELPDSISGRKVAYSIEYPSALPYYTLESTYGNDATYSYNSDAELQVMIHWNDAQDTSLRPTADQEVLIVSNYPEESGWITIPASDSDLWSTTLRRPAVSADNVPYTYDLESYTLPDGYDASVWKETVSGEGERTRYVIHLEFTRNDTEYTVISGAAEWIEPMPLEHDNAAELRLHVVQNGMAYDTPDPIFWDGDHYRIGEEPSTSFPRTDGEGNPYTYTIHAAAVPEGYAVYEKGLDVQLVRNDIRVCGTIAWEGNVPTRTSPQATLLRNGVPVMGPIAAEALSDRDAFTYGFSGLPYANELGEPYVYDVRISMGEQDPLVEITVEEPSWYSDETGFSLHADAVMKQKEAEASARITVHANVVGSYPGASYPEAQEFKVVLTGATDTDPNVYQEGVFNKANNYTWTFEVAGGMTEANREYGFRVYQEPVEEEHWNVDPRRFSVTVVPKYIEGPDPVCTVEIDHEGIFTNHYVTSPAEITLKVKNNVEIYLPDGMDVPETDFVYEVVDLTDSPADLLDQKNVAANAVEAFESFRLNVPGEYTFAVSLRNKEETGWLFDKDAHIYHVTVDDPDRDGNLEAMIKVDGHDSDTAEFTNLYAAAAVQLPLIKHVHGSEEPTETFRFEAMESGCADTRMEQQIQGSDFTDQSFETSFAEILFTEEGTHTYKVRELRGESGYWDYDENVFTETIRVVREESTGKLTAEITGPAAVFENAYVSADVSLEVVFEDGNRKDLRPAVLEIPLRRVIDGGNPETGDVFVLNEENGWKGTIANLPYYEEGSEEVRPPIDYIVEPMTISGYQTAVVSEPAHDHFVLTFRRLPDPSPDPDPKPTPRPLPIVPDTSAQFFFHTARVDLLAHVVLDYGMLEQGMSTFVLEPADACTPMPAYRDEAGTYRFMEQAQAVNDGRGDVMFDTILINTPGVYTYTIHQIEGPLENCVYDGQEKTVTVTVYEDENGRMKAEISGDAKFRNILLVSPEETMETGEYFLKSSAVWKLLWVVCPALLLSVGITLMKKRGIRRM